ncbi:putative amidohydrolase [Hydrogenophaga palleronii]|uniref:Amidohydrolase n=1 Tax=Hydrogenophaga palleronii TaxID=65655 RepID=A0ABU1WQ90_9BURK|nr:carbon-nitrogen hydrolase family protein [Hydrogenophaga palleronii]MDR7151465.1 putative amidohydrolase [Hydrogenophaga palleronii]
MPSRFTIAAAQTTPVAGDRAVNMEQHVYMVEMAARLGVQLLLFPELSLSGYEPQQLKSCLTSAHDPLLAPLKAAARHHEMTLVVGAPTAPAGETHAGGLPHISALVIGNEGEVLIYHKQHLHPGENSHAIAGPNHPFVFDVAGRRCGLAICADVTHATHPKAAREAGATLYLAGMVVSGQGYAVDAGLLKAHAITHRMPVLLANMGSPSGGYLCAGRSALWDEDGRCVAALAGDGAGLLVLHRQESGWYGRALTL